MLTDGGQSVNGVKGQQFNTRVGVPQLQNKDVKRGGILKGGG